jgi:hypothetical protein
VNALSTHATSGTITLVADDGTRAIPFSVTCQ